MVIGLQQPSLKHEQGDCILVDPSSSPGIFSAPPTNPSGMSVQAGGGKHHLTMVPFFGQVLEDATNIPQLAFGYGMPQGLFFHCVLLYRFCKLP